LRETRTQVAPGGAVLTIATLAGVSEKRSPNPFNLALDTSRYAAEIIALLAHPDRL
jgi:hypothetical protein